jgi:hypothetical protein
VSVNPLCAGETVRTFRCGEAGDGSGGSRITVDGQADADTSAAMRAAAESFFEGGLV